MKKSSLSIFKLIAFFSVVLLFSIEVQAQSKWDKKGALVVEKSEKDFKKGDPITNNDF